MAGTFEQLAYRYRDEHAKKRNRSWRQADFLIEKYLMPRWSKLSVKDIRRADVRGLFAKLTDTGAPGLANQVLAAASAIFSWAIKNEAADLAANPCHGIERNQTLSRERVLSDSEVPLFWKAFDEAGLLASSALKLVLLTGQRPGEIRCMRWEHLDIGEHRFTDSNGRRFKATGAWWSLPGQPDKNTAWPGTKNGQTHRVWLPKAVTAILDELDDGKGQGFVLASARGLPIQPLAGLMRAACERAGLGQDIKATPHDLRRTHGTTITSLGFSREQMNRIQNHKEGGVGSVYDRHGYQTESYRIQEAVAAKILALIEGEAERKVVPLHA